MPYLTLAEINSNPIYQPPAEWTVLTLLEQIETFDKEKLNRILTKNHSYAEKNTQLLSKDHFVNGHWVYQIVHNEFKKFTYVNLPLCAGHKGYGNVSDRFNNYYSNGKTRPPFGRYEHYEERLSLLKPQLYEWCKLNNLKVNKSTSAKKMIKLLWEMENIN